MTLPYTSAATAQIVISGHFDMYETYTTRRPQGTSDWLLILTVAGCGYVRTSVRADAQERLLEPGELLLLEPSTPHDYGLGPGGHWELLWVHFVAPWAWEPLLRWPEWCGGVKVLGGEDALPALRRDFGDLNLASSGFGKHRERLSSNALERLLLRCDELNALSAEGIVDRRILRAVDFLGQHLSGQHLGEPLTLSELGRHCHLSPSRLSHLFSEQLGVSPRAFLERQRLERAKELLSLTTLSVAKIAEQVGFESPFYFSRRFRRYAALSPKAYRAQHGR